MTNIKSNLEPKAERRVALAIMAEFKRAAKEPKTQKIVKGSQVTFQHFGRTITGTVMDVGIVRGAWNIMKITTFRGAKFHVPEHALTLKS